jgi:molybdenum cofactor guanylyltransferase
MNDVTGVILAGGKSRRMGEDKRFVTVGAATLLDRCRMIMVDCFKEVLIITAQDSAPLDGHGCQVYQDLIPDCGSLGGLYTGLHHASGGRIFVVACDMPFLDPKMIRFFVAHDPNADVVMGRLSSGLQPMHAVYAKAALPVLEQRARGRHLKIQALASDLSLNVTVVDRRMWSDIDPASRSFKNVNTPADLAAARADASDAPLLP